VLLSSVIACSITPASARQTQADRQPTLAEIAVAYPSYQKITESPVQVNVELMLQCAPTRPEQLEAARAEHGPHARASILVFMNDAAARVFAARSGTYPVGSVIVKHKTISASFGVGGMVKRAPGFDPAHGDWEYFYFEDPAKIDGGRISTCIECHASAKRTDYVFGTWKQ
jgi:hypothetical protein